MTTPFPLPIYLLNKRKLMSPSLSLSKDISQMNPKSKTTKNIIVINNNKNNDNEDKGNKDNENTGYKDKEDKDKEQ